MAKRILKQLTDLEGCAEATVVFNLLTQELEVKDSKRLNIVEPISGVALAKKLLEETG